MQARNHLMLTKLSGAKKSIQWKFGPNLTFIRRIVLEASFPKTVIRENCIILSNQAKAERAEKTICRSSFSKVNLLQSHIRHQTKVRFVQSTFPENR